MTDDILHGDFETRSVVDLKKFGLFVYANHPQTSPWCFCYAFNDEPVETWTPGTLLPARVINHIKNGGRFVGHNVQFEWYIWNYIMVPRFGWPVLKISQCDCTMARAYAMAYPGSLEKLAPALGIGGGKDMQGHALMRKMMKPRSYQEDGTPIWWDEPDKIARLVRYCCHDVVTERNCDAKLMPLADTERALWLLDQRINHRGITVDRAAIDATRVEVEATMKRMNKQMREASGGEITKVSEAKRTLEWCQVNGVELDSLKKNDIKDILENPDLPYDVREVLEIRSNSAKISVAKLDTMDFWSLADGRLHGQFQFHGASTGRFAGRGVQLHNLPRPETAWEEADLQNRLITDLTAGTIDSEFIEDIYGPFMRVISSCIRGYLVAAPGMDLIGADLKNIESVTLAWLAGEDWKLNAFRENFFMGGPGIYELVAGKILGIDYGAVSKWDRQVWGKVSELSLGFGGGKGAYKSMAVNYGVKLEDEKAEEIKLGWRAENPRTVAYWSAVECAAMEAMKFPGRVVTPHEYYDRSARRMMDFAVPRERRVYFRFADDILFLKLPSGRVLCYPYPEIQNVTKPWGEGPAVTFMTTDSRVKSKTKGKFIRLSSYGGKFVENITQATARDILKEGMFRVEEAGYPIVLHVHDESVSEIVKGMGHNSAVAEYEELMTIIPAWATDMPLAADGWRGERYRK